MGHRAKTETKAEGIGLNQNRIAHRAKGMEQQRAKGYKKHVKNA